ncbi:ABC transporter substrate-binding protein [Marinovum sp. 2_MG-2023]|uniref:ABC transporter substrate-binding protein n=1 Tax=unclassified Marinovum TaxID=2647166 RepID=UPI0026E24F0A|nr:MULTISPECIES: ABC transporter substrate-binding protein [unclassified Marinovum]MDO6732373.1 ABC transporter substrate-binding protein [Marinovum sp. 2_MG-2023]MDO6781690.1 ABC transporter substrate-binding protein [Marinovum sp. 1_MG-2023]
MQSLTRRHFLSTASALVGAGTSGVLFPAAAAFAQDLPPLNERLPENPLVITPTDRPGKRGGTWNHALVGGGSLSMLVRYQGYEPLVRFDPAWTKIEANVAESWEVSADSRTYTFNLRKGHKWSDGTAYTTEDIRFWYEDLLLDPEITLANQSYWSTGGEIGKLDVIDETKFSVTFSEPNGFFLQNLAWAQFDQLTRAPSAYLKQFHAKYNPDADKLAQERGFDSWVALFQREHGLHQDNVFFQNSSRPTLNAWAFTSAPGEDTERAIAVRNDYYFKVDTEGTQLPYFDKVMYQMVADPEVLLLKALQGEVDLMDQYIGTPTNKPVLFDGKADGDYDFYTLKESAANVMVFQLNLNHTDATKRDLFNKRDFREALSIAIDRQALIDAVFVGQGSPAQPSISESDPLYNERLAKQHTEYDPDRANEILDTLVPDRDSEGYRLDAEGRRLSIIFEIDQVRTTFLDMFELALPMFQDVGIDAQIRTMDRSLWETRVRNGRDFDASAHQFGANAGIAAMIDPRYLVPFSSNSIYAPGWARYYIDPTAGDAEEPPAEIKAQQELYRKLLSTGDPDMQKELFGQMLDNAADQFLVFGVSLPPDGYGIVKNDMVNTMDVMPNSFGWPTPGPARPEQFFKSST